jgi:hypothetical protein
MPLLIRTTLSTVTRSKIIITWPPNSRETDRLAVSRLARKAKNATSVSARFPRIGIRPGEK